MLSAPKDAGAVAYADRRLYSVGAVTIPDLLDRPQIVLRSDANTIEVLDFDRWGAPLSDQLQRVLAADLSARLGEGAIEYPGLAGRSSSDRRITVSIIEFDSERDGESVLEASWAISDGQPSETTSNIRTGKVRHIARARGSDVREIVATMSDLVTMLADDIARGLAAHPG